ncbi:MAG: mitochondrial fission ELM1 family protein [Alphaproteobacteria bacterium]|nr:mitochondrial fission ELM1 family protein [Alphaproteobacteria bacterium]
MKIIGIETEGAGTNNQMRGVILEGYKNRSTEMTLPVTKQELLKAEDGRLLHPKNFSDITEFESAVQQAVTLYLQRESAPKYVILPVDHAALADENKQVDILSGAVKKAFAHHGHSVKTMALASNLYDYQNVDLIHVGKHLLSDADEKKLATSPQLKARVVETLGVPGNLSWLRINAEANGPQKKNIIDKYRGKKNVLFSLGGKTENGAIKFTLKDAERLFKSALALKAQGYNVIFTNSPRTPNDVTDFLYEKCKTFHMDFFNSKKIATTEEEKNNFRIYTGKHNAEFVEQAAAVGNIYPAILSLFEPNRENKNKGFVINTHDSFSYTSDAAALGIPSVVYTGNTIDNSRFDCYKLFHICAAKGYVIDLEDAIQQTLARKEVKTNPMDNVAKQLVLAMEKSVDTNKREKSQAREYY